MHLFKYTLTRLMVLSVLLFAGWSTVMAQVIDYPDWFIMPPESGEDYTFSVGSGWAATADEARNEAIKLTKSYLNEELATKIEILYLMYFEETENEEVFPAFVRVRSAVAESVPEAAEIYDEHTTTDDDGMTQVFILVRLSQEKALEHLLDFLYQEEELYIKLQRSTSLEMFINDFHQFGY